MTVDAAARLAAARGSRWTRWRMTAGLGLRMMVHDRAKFVGTTLGVVFAVVLASQQLGMLGGLLAKNTMLVDHGGADLWVVPRGTTLVQPGQRMPTQVLYTTRGTPGVAVASPLVMTASAVQRPGGGAEAITLIGFDPDAPLGGPWNVVAGDVAALRRRGALFFEDSQRERMGGLNLGSVREVQGRRVRVAGFTWGLMPFGAPYTFGSVDTVRELAGMPEGRLNFVLVRVAPLADVEEVQAELQRRLPGAVVYTADQLHGRVVDTLLGMQLGVVFGTTTAFALVIGFVIVALTMFSAVLDNLRELATLKALGLSSGDLTRLVVVQAIAQALLGSLIGLGLTAYVVDLIRSANLAVIVSPTLVVATPPVMAALCVAASLLALRRVRRLDPASVFR
ncbi:MAG: FtsX-like permease family protein [Kofleriaceae bacterium]|nr:FtsX-like permease family protein [Myxococcales bacterium]MCB9560850.1 FtsX-like permease family protein [Kofleriaceae bacterium]